MEKIGFIDKYLSLWIFLCMGTGILVGYYVPDVNKKLGSATFADVSIPIAVGLIWMMYPILCAVRFEILHKILAKKTIWKDILFSLGVNWVIAPLVMVGLGWAMLPDLVEYRSGLVLVGTARCIAMVLIWNRLAGADEEFCAILVSVNSLLQVVLFGPLSYFYVVVLSKGTYMGINMIPVFKSVLIFLGIPLLAAICTRLLFRRMCPDYYDKKFMPFIAPTSLLALLFIIIVMFASQGRDIIINIKTVARVIAPLVAYFIIMFFGVMFVCYHYRIPYKIATTQSFTAASNNFELAIAVAASVYGESSKEVMAATIGPLVEVPIMLAFVKAAFFIKSRYFDKQLAPQLSKQLENI
ncbi:hypothetical protein BB561_001751 [Smittium simulii]|uniref:Arsenical-resistance protein n=1 Tax=Smittium simulii TaxID=133385 RepID=A0A2T9YT89_9FUNG|nr:hypothetical protein BB561_001751 [Smittium simulii]